MGFLDDIGESLFGGGKNKRGTNTMKEADQASGRLMDVGGAQGAAAAGQAGQALGQQMGNQMGQTAATLGSQAATQAARTAGVNKGQAALLGGQEAGRAFTSSQQAGQLAGQQLGMGAYDTAANRQLAATQLHGNIGATEQGAGQGALTQGMGALTGLATGALGLSDENAKKDIKDSESLDKASDLIKPIDFKYKDGGGEKTGVLAQDVEKVNPENVVETPKGKAIDVAQQTGTNTARISEAGQRIKRLEELVGRRKNA
jgi:hypothetical protein